VQIFANPECTEYADGSVATVYARINVPWGFNEAWTVGDLDQAASYFSAGGPSSGYQTDPYAITLWENWHSEDSAQPYQVGEVVELTPAGSIVPIDNPTVIFTKP